MGRGKSATKKRAKRIREKNQANLLRMKEFRYSVKRKGISWKIDSKEKSTKTKYSLGGEKW